jgi:hypothetical protein
LAIYVAGGFVLTDNDLQAIRDAGLIDDAKLAQISAFLKEWRRGDTIAQAPRFDLTHVLWYAGALIVMGAMGLFTTEAFNRMGGWALTICGAIYATVFTVAGHYLWKGKDLRVPGGLLVAVAVSMVPMMVYGIQDALDLWKYAQGRPGDYQDFFPYMHGSWLYMEIAAIIAALVAVYRYPFPFILAIAGVALWFMSMDLALWFTRSPVSYDDFETRRLVSILFGLAMIVAAWAADVIRRDGPDFPFWIHIFGIMAFWGGLTLHEGGTELQKFIYCLINIGLIGLSVFLNRRVYAVFGALGVATYLGYLAYDVFKDVIAFSFALSAIGLVIILLGLALHRSRARIAEKLDAALPQSLKRLRPAHASTL